MNLMKKAVSLLKSQSAKPVPAGKIYVHDPHPLNWLYITYNTVEELVRVSTNGNIEPAAMSRYRWVNNRTLEVQVRGGTRFPDGESLTPATVKQNFDEVMRWTAPHPPGTQFNLDPATRCEISGADTVRFLFPKPDGMALGKLRAIHMMSTAFWKEIGFGYARNGSGEGHW
jgi:ABC-type transport system substrate-binding protein